MLSDAERMSRLFAGCDEAYGTYDKLEGRPGSLKKEIKKTAQTVREPLTVDLWTAHLEGKKPLGVIPIDKNNECVWGCVDIDEYTDIEHAHLVEIAEKHSYPVVVCKTKSGGAHVFLFVADPVPASEMREKLEQLSVVLGAGGSEIFPKQTEVLIDRGDLGNWLNMPYFEAARTSRFCVTSDERQLSLAQFLDYAEQRVIDSTLFADIGSPAEADIIEDLEDGPPCLQHLASRGFPKGSRNNGLFALGVLAKRKYPDAWEAQLENWNRRFMDPPLDSSEVMMVNASLRKKDYAYRCKDQPIVSYCDAKACRKRKYGVGGGGNHPVITGITVLDSEPKMFFVNLSDGGTIECSSPQLLNPRLFQQCALDQRMVVLPLIKYDEWISQVNSCMASATVTPAPEEISTRGIFFEHLERFCTDKHRAQTPEEMLLGKPWFDELGERYCFRLRDLMEYLDRMKFKDFQRMHVINRIKAEQGDRAFMNLNGKGTNYWWVPMNRFSVQVTSHATDQIHETPI